MGTRGRQPKSTLKSKYYFRPTDTYKLNYKVGLPEAPKHLSAEAKKLWEFLVSEMAASRVLQVVDGPGLAELCEGEVLLQSLYQTVPKGKAIAKFCSTKEGILIFRRIDKLSKRVGQLRKTYGLDPEGRARIANTSPLPTVDNALTIAPAEDDSLCA